MLSYIPKPMVYRLLGKWMSRRLPLGFANIDLRHACFVSDFRKQQYLEAGLPVENAIVIPGGVDIRKFKTSQPQKSFTELIKILCAAQLYKGKGIHTAIDAIDLLLKQGYKNISLTISGEELGGTEYTEFLDKKVQRSEALMKSVKFTGKVSYDKMPEIYHYHDWFISASIIPEGFPLTIIEAMASGLVVFATGTGGGREVLQHNENGMVFPPGDPEALASQMKFIIQHPEIQRKLSENALKTAQKFDIQPVATTIETYLEAILGLKT
jgi:glycosyltransferase involved in cell wall biosynthesis